MITHYTGEAGSLREGAHASPSRLGFLCNTRVTREPVHEAAKNGEEREGSSLRPGFVEPELVGSSYLGATRVAVEARIGAHSLQVLPQWAQWRR